MALLGLLALCLFGLVQASPGTNLDCDFEKDSCYWTQENTGSALDWVRFQGPTTDLSTSPSGDHTSGSGSSMLFPNPGFWETQNGFWETQNGFWETQNGFWETQNGFWETQNGFWETQNASLISPAFKGNGSLEFFYSMRGPKNISLTLSAETSSTKVPFWEKTGDLQLFWYLARIYIPPSPEDFKIVFTAAVPLSGSKGYIAIDDIKFLPGEQKDLPFTDLSLDWQCLPYC